MFVIEDSPIVGVSGDTRWVSDERRRVWLQRIGSYAMSWAESFQVHVGDRVYLVERVREQQHDAHYHSTIVNLGFSPIGSLVTGITSDTFGSNAERREVGLLAVEALLVYGSFYNGSTDPETNTETIEFNGRSYSLSDFYPS